jgi:hypothetical protein
MEFFNIYIKDSVNMNYKNKRLCETGFFLCEKGLCQVVIWETGLYQKGLCELGLCKMGLCETF